MILTHKLKGHKLIITKINFTDPYIAHKINNIGLVVGNVIKVLDYNSNNSILHLEVYGTEYVLRERDCFNIEVQECKD